MLDCANGAMIEVAPAAFERLGARCRSSATSPTGRTSTPAAGPPTCGSLARVVPRGGADLGVAFDGDGDRMLAVDAAGNEVDGDQILAVLALHLGVDLVAVTQMTNLGFHRLMAEHGIRVLTTDVGDRYVLEALRAEGGVLGGEQSGHVLYLDGHTTGDGLVAGLLLCRAVVEQGRTLADLAAVMPRYPQVKENVRVRARLSPSVLEEAARLGDELEGRGRVLVRPSGTEPVVRVLAEAETEEERAVSVVPSALSFRESSARRKPGSRFFVSFFGTVTLHGRSTERAGSGHRREDGRGCSSVRDHRIRGLEDGEGSSAPGPRAARVPRL